MNFGTPEIQKQILLEIQQLDLNGSFNMPKAWMTEGVNRAVVDMLYLMLRGLGAQPSLLGTINRWGDTLTPEAVLEQLRNWNHRSNGNRA